MISDLFMLVLGFLLVCEGGDLFVDSSISIAAGLRIPRAVVGGTIVSLATTMPELIVSATASLMKNPGIALGNAVGSVIANIGLILGVSVVLVPVEVDGYDFKRRSIWMMISALLLILFCRSLYLNRFLALLLFLGSPAYLYFDHRMIKTHRSQKTPSVIKVEEPMMSTRKSSLFFSAGALLVIVGSRILVRSAVGIASTLGIPSVIIGLTIIAVGTSLPELVTALTAAKKGVPDLSIGNIIGANVLNLTMIVGVSGMISPLTLSRSTQLYSFPWLMIFVSLMVSFLWREGRLTRLRGLLLLGLYFIYIAGLVVMPFILKIG